MFISRQLVLSTAALLLVPPIAGAQGGTSVRRYPLASVEGLRSHSVSVASVTYEGKRGIRLIVSDSARQRLEGLPIEQRRIETFAIIEGTDFGDGTIELEVARAPAPGVTGGARGFVGVAFRLQPDLEAYDAFNLRPTNGRADDQVRRNHSAQYIAHPDWPWERLRRETPERYESYVDLVPGVWTHMRIEVRDARARLLLHDQAQPTLILDDLKSGASGRGTIALWIGPGTIAHFRDLRIHPR